MVINTRMKPAKNIVSKTSSFARGQKKQLSKAIMSTTTAGGRCVNCGEVNTLGDCCPACASFDCDVCGKQIDFDDDIYCEKTDRRMCISCSTK